MSTSPSWFDQEKFSRLVKKKTAPKPAPTIGGAGVTPVIQRGPQQIAPVPPRRGSGTLPQIPQPGHNGSAACPTLGAAAACRGSPGFWSLVVADHPLGGCHPTDESIPSRDGSASFASAE